MSSKRKRTPTDDTDVSVISTPAPTDSSVAGGNDRSSPEIVEVLRPKKKTNSRRTKESFDERWNTAGRSNEDILQDQMATWKSSVYEHFQKPKILVVDNKVKYQFVCKRQPHIILSRARTDDNTTNLKRHVDSCEGKLAPAGQRIEEYAHGSTYDKSRFRFVLSMWCARRHRPYAIVQDEELLRAFRMLYAKVEVPHPTTISRDVREIFRLAKKRLAALLQAYPGRVHLCIDGWTSPNVISFLGVTVTRLVDGHIETCILDFIKLFESHTGQYLAKKLIECLKDFGITTKILGITADNASNNDTLVAELEVLRGANSVKTRVRCFAHVWNLVVKAILSLFMKKKSKRTTKKAKAQSKHREAAGGSGDDSDDLGAIDDKSSGSEGSAEDEIEDESDLEDDNDASSRRAKGATDDEDDLELDAEREAADERELDEIIAELEKEYQLTPEEKRVGRTAVTKLTRLAKRVFHSPTLREDLQVSCNEAEVTPKEMVRSVDTRWNSLALAIERAIYLKNALDKMFDLTKYKSGVNSLAAYRLSEIEWTLLTELWPVLNFFLRATERVSKSGVALLHEVIPLIDSLTERLAKTVDNKKLSKLTRLAAARGLHVLNKYYSKTDDSIMYRLAIMLHPRFKTNYFHIHEWEDEWISNAKFLLRQHWEKYYKPKATADSSATQVSTVDDDLFADIDNFGREQSVDVLDAYLTSPTLPNIGDPIPYWQSQLAGGDPLAQMALNVLSTPASSVDVERAFSRGGLTVSKRRHALSDESVRAATVLSSWANVNGVVDEEEIVQVFKDKRRRLKKATTANVYIDITDDEDL